MVTKKRSESRLCVTEVQVRNLVRLTFSYCRIQIKTPFTVQIFIMGTTCVGVRACTGRYSDVAEPMTELTTAKTKATNEQKPIEWASQQHIVPKRNTDESEHGSTRLLLNIC